MKKLLAIVLALVVLLVTILTVNASPTASILTRRVQLQREVHLAPQAVTIQFGGFLGAIYSPSTVFIAPGENVKWQGDFTFHPLVSDEVLWATINSGTQFEFFFNTPGIYHFHCLIHGAFGMNGVVFVGRQTYIPIVIH